MADPALIVEAKGEEWDFNPHVSKLTKKQLEMLKGYTQGVYDPMTQPIVFRWVEKCAFQLKMGLRPPDCPVVRVMAVQGAATPGVATQGGGGFATQGGKGGFGAAGGKGGKAAPPTQPATRPPPPAVQNSKFMPGSRAADTGGQKGAPPAVRQGAKGALPTAPPQNGASMAGPGKGAKGGKATQQAAAPVQQERSASPQHQSPVRRQPPAGFGGGWGGPGKGPGKGVKGPQPTSAWAMSTGGFGDEPPAAKGGGKGGFGGPGAQEDEEPDEHWLCTQCGRSNWPDRDTCHRRDCKAPRGNAPVVPLEKRPDPEDGVMRTKTQFMRKYNLGMQNGWAEWDAAGPQRGLGPSWQQMQQMSGDWQCPCGCSNFSSRYTCRDCGKTWQEACGGGQGGERPPDEPLPEMVVDFAKPVYSLNQGVAEQSVQPAPGTGPPVRRPAGRGRAPPPGTGPPPQRRAPPAPKGPEPPKVAPGCEPIPRQYEVETPPRMGNAAGLYHFLQMFEAGGSTCPTWKHIAADFFIVSDGKHWCIQDSLTQKEGLKRLRSTVEHNCTLFPHQMEWPQPKDGSGRLKIQVAPEQDDGWDAGVGGGAPTQKRSPRRAVAGADEDDEVVECEAPEPTQLTSVEGPRGPDGVAIKGGKGGSSADGDAAKEEYTGPQWRCTDCEACNPLSEKDCLKCGTSRDYSMYDPRSKTAERRLDVDGDAYTKREFIEYWGDEADEKWNEATPVGFGGAAWVRDVASLNQSALNDVRQQTEFLCDGCGKCRLLGDHGEDGKLTTSHRLRCGSKECGNAWRTWVRRNQDTRIDNMIKQQREEEQRKKFQARDFVVQRPHGQTTGGGDADGGPKIHTLKGVQGGAAPARGAVVHDDDDYGEQFTEDDQATKPVPEWDPDDVAKWAALHQVQPEDLQLLRDAKIGGKEFLWADAQSLKDIGIVRKPKITLVLHARDALVKKFKLVVPPRPESAAPATQSEEEMRIPPDEPGVAYSFKEYQEFYGADAQIMWDKSNVADAEALQLGAEQAQVEAEGWDETGDDGDGWGGAAAGGKPAVPDRFAGATLGGAVAGGGGGGSAGGAKQSAAPAPDPDDW